MSRQYKSYGRDQINIENILFQIREQSKRSKFEQIVLNNITAEIYSRLESPLDYLDHLDPINLRKTARSDKVSPLWERKIKIRTRSPQPIPPQTTIVDVFKSKKISGRLLILGKPGSGKTTTLLDLAKNLVNSAIKKVDEPIPVLFNLSSWKGKSIQDWLVKELKFQYGVSISLGEQWIKEYKLTLLLDGLDEVYTNLQEQCVAKINEFLRGENCPENVVICCRYLYMIREKSSNCNILISSLLTHINFKIFNHLF